MTHDFRDSAFASIEKMMTNDKNILILYNDMGAMGLDKIKECFPERVINAGIAEQNMASIAAGLAMTGKLVFIYGIIAHIFARGFEQIRNDICLANIPVVILGIGSGLSYGSDGPTHHGIHDIAVMRTLPNMSIYNPSDCISAEAAIRIAASGKGPAYIRLDKDQLPNIYRAKTSFKTGLSVLHEGKDISLLSTGTVTHRALLAAKELKNEGISVKIVDIFRLKPLNEIGIIKTFSNSKAVVTLEENSPVGGLGSIIAELMAKNNCRQTFNVISLADEAMLGVVNRELAEKKYRLALAEIVIKLRDIAKRD